jgi:hypothetical protein
MLSSICFVLGVVDLFLPRLKSVGGAVIRRAIRLRWLTSTVTVSSAARV